MKKLFAIIISLMLFATVFTLTASADGANTFSEDYKTLYYGGNVYHCFDSSWLVISTNDKQADIVRLTDKQQNEVKQVMLWLNEEDTAAQASIDFKDGSYLTVNYLRSDLFAEYKAVLSGNKKEYWVNFGYDEGSKVVMNKSLLEGETKQMTLDEYWMHTSEIVYAQSGAAELEIMIGELISDGSGAYYFINYIELGISQNYNSGWPDKFEVHIVDDPDLVSRLAEAEEKVMTEFDHIAGGIDDFADFSTLVVLITLLIILPAAVFIFGLVMTIVYKRKPYRGIYARLTIVCASELIIASVITIVVIINKLTGV